MQPYSPPETLWELDETVYYFTDENIMVLRLSKRYDQFSRLGAARRPLEPMKTLMLSFLYPSQVDAVLYPPGRVGHFAG
jgi:hypothetical protein